MNLSTKKAVTVIFSLSVFALALLIWLIYFRSNPVNLENNSLRTVLPALNAFFNLVTAVFLIIGRQKIKSNDVNSHKKFMKLSFLTSCLFLAGYLVYHSMVGETKFIGVGVIKYIYFFILISHIILSFPLLPLVGLTFYFALTQQFNSHKRVAPPTYYIWLYVSVTGVLVFLFLKFLNH
jgi:putative membrane protein